MPRGRRGFAREERRDGGKEEDDCAFAGGVDEDGEY
jgi:hypothetical protein